MDVIEFINAVFTRNVSDVRDELKPSKRFTCPVSVMTRALPLQVS